MILFAKIVFLLLAYSTACLGGGTLALRVLVCRSNAAIKQSAGTMLATAFALGQGLLASLWLLLALVGWFSRPVIAGVGVVFALSGIILTRHWFYDFARQIVHLWRELRADSWEWQAVAILTLILCAAWGTSLGRDLDGDATAFYMALSKVIAASHRLVPLPGYEGFSSTGLQGEMHYAALMALGSPDAARLFAWPTMLAGAIILLTICRQAGIGRRGQWIALAMVFTSSAVIWSSGDGKTDLFAVPLGLAAYYWILQIHRELQRLALFLVGLFSGFAIIAKLSYLPVMAPGIVLLLFWGFLKDFQNSGKRKQAMINVVMAGLQIFAGLLIAITPHIIKSFLLFHNPIAPIGMGWTNEVWFGTATIRRIVLTYPFALTFGTYWGQYGSLSPLVLAFLPLALLLSKPRSLFASPLFAISMAALVGLLTWLITNPSVLAPRYILVVLLLFVPLAARAAEHVSQNDSRPRLLALSITISMSVILVATGLYFINKVFFPQNTFEYLSGTLSDCDRESNYCDAMEAINRVAKPGDRVFLMTYYRYYLRADLIQCLSNSADFSAFQTEKSVVLRWVYLYEHGFRYLLADQTLQASNVESLNLKNPPAWVKLHLLYTNYDNLIQSYRIDVLDPPGQQQVHCEQIHPPAWDLTGG